MHADGDPLALDGLAQQRFPERVQVVREDRDDINAHECPELSTDAERITAAYDEGVLQLEFSIDPTDTAVGVMQDREHRAEGPRPARRPHHRPDRGDRRRGRACLQGRAGAPAAQAEGFAAGWLARRSR